MFKTITLMFKMLITFKALIVQLWQRMSTLKAKSAKTFKALRMNTLNRK